MSEEIFKCWLSWYQEKHPEASQQELLRAAFDAGGDYIWFDEGKRGVVPQWLARWL